MAMVEDEYDEGGPSRGVDEYWAIVLRRRWCILLPLFACWVLAFAGSWVLPSTYQSEALILVEQPRVPEQYVVPNVTVNLQDRLQSMTQQILSRTRLQETINRLHLYQTRHRWDLTQARDPIEQMRKDIKIDLVEAPDRPGELTAFKIRYSAPTPQLAQRVNSELTTLFINENLKAQQQLSEGTTAFLQSQLADASAKLQEQEEKVRAFKAAHFGDLPSQMESNLQILTGLQNQLQSTQHDLDEANQQKLYLESLEQQYQSVEANLGVGNGTVAAPDTLDKDLLDLRRQLQEDQLRYTDDYPDIIRLRDKIAELEKLKKQMGSETAANTKPTTPSGVDPGSLAEVERGAPSPMMQVQSQLKANRLEIQNYQQQTKKIESQIADYQARLNLTPATEQELADVSRGYEESKANYDSLLQKQNQSQLATSLEEQEQGEQFRILDPPSLPARPSFPNHLLISLGGLAAGLTIGVLLTTLLEVTNVRVRHEKDLEDVTPLKVLVGIPHLDVPGEVRNRALVRRLELSAVAAMAILVLVGNLYAFLKS